LTLPGIKKVFDATALGPMLWFFKYFCRKIRRKNWRFWLKTKLNYEKIDHNIGFWEKRQFFRRKLSKIAKNCDHNIDPWWRGSGLLLCIWNRRSRVRIPARVNLRKINDKTFWSTCLRMYLHTCTYIHMLWTRVTFLSTYVVHFYLQQKVLWKRTSVIMNVLKVNLTLKNFLQIICWNNLLVEIVEDLTQRDQIFIFNYIE
jgi:hypothetical protein